MKDENLIGSTYTTSDGYTATIIKYNGWYDTTVLLNDGTVLEKIVLGNLRKSSIRNPNHKTNFNVGYIGQGKYTSVGKDIRAYLTWKSMLIRCYDPISQIKRPSYTGCTVSEEWHNFQNFAAWFEENYKPEYMEGWHLDKDYHHKGNKVYSPETCILIPPELNSVITTRKAERGDLPMGVRQKPRDTKFQARLSAEGIRESLGYYDTPEEAFRAYKIGKQKHIRKLADKWKNLLTEKAYNYIVSYEIEITD